MPEASLLRRHCTGGETVVSFGRRLVFEYSDGDLGMRSLAIAALRDAGVPGLEIAEVFDLSPEQVSRLRARVRRLGSAGLAPLRGRPPELSKRNVATVRCLAAEGISQTEIAKRVGVFCSFRGSILARWGRSEPAVLVTRQPANSGEPSRSGPRRTDLLWALTATGAKRRAPVGPGQLP